MHYTSSDRLMYYFIYGYIHIHEGDLKSFRPSLHETRDKRPLDRESNRSWCHRHIMSMAPWALWAVCGQGEKFSA